MRRTLTMDLMELEGLVQQNVLLKSKIDELTAIQSGVKKSLKGIIEEAGVVDDRGHIVIELPHEVDGITKVMQQRRVSKSLDEDVAEALLSKKGIAERCIKMVPVLDEDEIMKAYYEGVISEEDIDTMFPSKVSYALVMTKG
jgi:hypothetical protein